MNTVSWLSIYAVGFITCAIFRLDSRKYKKDIQILSSYIKEFIFFRCEINDFIPIYNSTEWLLKVMEILFHYEMQKYEFKYYQ